MECLKTSLTSKGAEKRELTCGMFENLFKTSLKLAAGNLLEDVGGRNPLHFAASRGVRAVKSLVYHIVDLAVCRQDMWCHGGAFEAQPGEVGEFVQDANGSYLRRTVCNLQREAAVRVVADEKPFLRCPLAVAVTALAVPCASGQVVLEHVHFAFAVPILFTFLSVVLVTAWAVEAFACLIPAIDLLLTTALTEPASLVPVPPVV